MNHYLFDTRRTSCPYCGSSDGFAHLLHPSDRKVVGIGLGKCHSCNVFKTNNEAGFVSESGELVASKGIVEAKFYDTAKVKSFGLTFGSGGLVEYAMRLFGQDALDTAKQMYVCGDKYGNTSFLYADIRQRGMSIKTIAYDESGKRSKSGLSLGSRNLDTAQIAGYISPEGSVRGVRVSDGAYQLLYGQHSIRPDLPIVIVESEKTAYISSIVCKNATFLAAGGSKGLSANKIRGLHNANAVAEELVKSLANKRIIICFDYDESGESGSLVAQTALRELGATDVSVCNMEELLSKVSIPFPAHMREHSDLADVAIWCMTDGNMRSDIDLVFRTLLKKGSPDSVIERALEDNELQKITKLDHSKNPPKPSLLFREQSNTKYSQLAIPGNIVMLLASPGVGKSSIISALVARHVRPTTDAFGLDIDAPNGIVVIDTEQSKDQVVQLHKRMARRIGCSAEDIPDILETTGVNWFITNKKLKVEKQVDNLFAAVNTYSPSFVIVDQVGSLVQNVNSIDETTNLIKRIATDAELNLRTWIVVLHTNPTSDKGRGVLGSDIHRWASSVLFIRKPSEPGEPSLLTTNNADGTMAKVRAGAPVRCFFAWDEELGDFYPTQKTQAIEIEIPLVVSAIEEIYSSQGAAQPIAWGDLRKKTKELFGANQGTKIFNFLINEGWLKRQPNGKLWPDYDKINQSTSNSNQ
jgi:hypothetical protein